MTTLRDDEISKRIFYAGMFGLPWLWLVHSMGYYANQRSSGRLANSQESVIQTENPDAELVASNQLMWVQRCRNCACLGTFAWLVWVIFVQFLMPDAFPQSMFVAIPDQGEYTGW